MDRYSARINLHGTTQRERQLNLLKQNLVNKLPNALSCKNVLINGVDQSIEMVKTKDEHIKTIHSLPDETFASGDYVTYKTKTYLITKVDFDDEAYTSGEMQYCNHTLKFQHPETGAILSYPCISQVSNMSVGVSEGKVISTGNSIYTIKLPFDDNTKLINIDDRFFVDDLTVEKPLVYAVSKPDRTTYRYGNKGLIELTLKFDEYDESRDDKVLGICGKKDIVTPPPQGNTYSIIGTNNDFYLGYPFVVSAVPYDSDGTANNDVELVIDIAYPGGLSHLFVTSFDTNTCTITTKRDSYELLDEIITVNVSNGNGEYVGSKSFTITNL